MMMMNRLVVRQCTDCGDSNRSPVIIWWIWGLELVYIIVGGAFQNRLLRTRCFE